MTMTMGYTGLGFGGKGRGGGGDDPRRPTQGGKGHYLDLISADVWTIILEFLELGAWLELRGTNKSLHSVVQQILTQYPGALVRIHRQQRSRDIERYLIGSSHMGANWNSMSEDMMGMMDDALRSAARLDVMAGTVARLPGSRVNFNPPSGDAISVDPGYQRARQDALVVLRQQHARVQRDGPSWVVIVCVVALFAFLLHCVINRG